MKTFKTKVESDNLYEWSFECYENDEPINIGDPFIFFFGGIADVTICETENEKREINPNNKTRNKTTIENTIDLVHGFWKNCYKIKKTDFPLSVLK